MKKYAGFLVFLLFLGCNDESHNPLSMAENVSYGSSVVKLPSLAALTDTSVEMITYKFSLTITGGGMNPMKFAWPVGENGASFIINKIPAGTNRLFQGILYSSNGETYEGEAYTEIMGGQVANVNLVLRKTGSAQVNVIIEGTNMHDSLAGCFALKGIINNVDISKLVLEIPSISSDKFYGSFKQNNKMIGKFYGTVQGNRIEANVTIPEYKIPLSHFSGTSGSTYNSIKGDFFSIDSLPIGFMSGYKIPCNDFPPPSTCTYDTLGGPGSTSCKDTTTWIKYANEKCREQGKVLTNYRFDYVCSKFPLAFEQICFECCQPQK